jgi:hypothetical protein
MFGYQIKAFAALDEDHYYRECEVGFASIDRARRAMRERMTMMKQNTTPLEANDVLKGEVFEITVLERETLN